MSLIDVNGTTLYYEWRGRGPSLLFISGATGDAGHWTTIAETLAEEYTVITYDRRGNSRSPHPPDWTSTSTDEQADDAAELLRALDLAPAIVFGTSAGANILANLVLRDPTVLRGAVFHEPVFPSAAGGTGAFRVGRKALVEQGMAKGGPPAAMELFLRGVAGNAAFESLDPQLRERLLRNGDVFFGLEMEPFLGWEPTPHQLASVRLPCVVAAGTDNRDPAAGGHFRYEAARWLAAQLDTALVEVPDAHMPYLTRPRAFAEALHPLLDKLTCAGPAGLGGDRVLGRLGSVPHLSTRRNDDAGH
jgi:pimeloyl-ACP methyl ester carboxylesterase